MFLARAFGREEKRWIGQQEKSGRDIGHEGEEVDQFRYLLNIHYYNIHHKAFVLLKTTSIPGLMKTIIIWIIAHLRERMTKKNQRENKYCMLVGGWVWQISVYAVSRNLDGFLKRNPKRRKRRDEEWEAGKRRKRVSCRELRGIEKCGIMRSIFK